MGESLVQSQAARTESSWREWSEAKQNWGPQKVGGWLGWFIIGLKHWLNLIAVLEPDSSVFLFLISVLNCVSLVVAVIVLMFLIVKVSLTDWIRRTTGSRSQLEVEVCQGLLRCQRFNRGCLFGPCICFLIELSYIVLYYIILYYIIIYIYTYQSPAWQRKTSEMSN